MLAFANKDDGIARLTSNCAFHLRRPIGWFVWCVAMDYKEAFTLFDQNGDGKIDAAELKAVRADPSNVARRVARRRHRRQ